MGNGISMFDRTPQATVRAVSQSMVLSTTCTWSATLHKRLRIGSLIHIEIAARSRATYATGQRWCMWYCRSWTAIEKYGHT